VLKVNPPQKEARRKKNNMKCLTCGREHQNERGKCPYCSSPTRLAKKQSERPEWGGASSFKSVGVCPKRGRETTGKLICVSRDLAETLNWKTGAFLPDSHEYAKAS
jgi:DNA-directed RNA polymerase subunit RPC12/RpoP